MKAWDWKGWYAREREALGVRGLDALLDGAPQVELPARGGLVFPHTKLRGSGALVAAAARACVRSGREEILALGVLHGARREDAAAVAAARGGDAAARAQLRRVHGPGAPGDEGRWTEEFSLDNFRALVEREAARQGRRPPRLIERYPFLTGACAGDLPGLDELRAAFARGAGLVATADPIHHGAGYGTPAGERRALDDPATLPWAVACVMTGFAHLLNGRFEEFLTHAEAAKSDFRDAGPVVAGLIAAPFTVHPGGFALVDYADVLQADPPTWVAAALVAMR